jgi:hypothetical protein
MVAQLERGEYHLTTPDIGSNLLVGQMTALAPKSGPAVLRALLSPVVAVVTSVVGGLANRAARKYNTANGYPEKGQR